MTGNEDQEDAPAGHNRSQDAVYPRLKGICCRRQAASLPEDRIDPTIEEDVERPRLREHGKNDAEYGQKDAEAQKPLLPEVEAAHLLSPM